MTEILLMKEKIIDSINLVNTINALSPNIRIYKIISNLDECLSIVEKHSIDLLLIEYNLFIDLNIIDYTKIDKNVKHIIVLVENDNNQINSKYIFSNNENLLTNINKVLKLNINNKNDKKFIFEELKYLGYNPAYYGTKYLVECIYYIYKNYGIYDENSIAEVYPIIAKKYNKTVNNIKCNITRATSIMFCECEEKKLKEYLGMCTLPKTGSRVIIQTIINKLHRL